MDVIPLLEEIIEQPIPSLNDYDLRHKNWRTQSSGDIREAIRDVEEGRWRIDFLYPTLLDDGVWDENLRIIFSRGEFDGTGDYVSVITGPVAELSIVGQIVAFSGQLPVDEDERKGILENALVEVFINPKSFAPLNHPLDARGYHPLHPWELVDSTD